MEAKLAEKSTVRTTSRGVMNERVSIVIIGRNEERAIDKCVGAALAAAEQIGGAEIIFVDSASTDRTVEIVQSLGVRVISMKPTMKLSPSAGRFVGSKYAHGEFILFLDADTLVYKDFLPKAIEHFDRNPEIGGINGFLDDLDENGEVLADVEERYETVADAKWLRGPCCLYRRAALEKSSSFNPHLAVEEEAELGLRLIKNGWKLNILPIPMACHTRCFHQQTIESVISIFQRDIVVGRLGEMTRTAAYAFHEGNGLMFCWLRLKTTILFVAWLFVAMLCHFLPASFYPQLSFSAITLFGLAAIFLKKRNLRQALVFIPSKLISLVDILAGLHKIKLKSPRNYFLDVVEYK